METNHKTFCIEFDDRQCVSEKWNEFFTTKIFTPKYCESQLKVFFATKKIQTQKFGDSKNIGYRLVAECLYFLDRNVVKAIWCQFFVIKNSTPKLDDEIFVSEKCLPPKKKLRHQNFDAWVVAKCLLFTLNNFVESKLKPIVKLLTSKYDDRTYVSAKNKVHCLPPKKFWHQNLLTEHTCSKREVHYLPYLHLCFVRSQLKPIIKHLRFSWHVYVGKVFATKKIVPPKWRNLGTNLQPNLSVRVFVAKIAYFWSTTCFVTNCCVNFNCTFPFFQGVTEEIYDITISSAIFYHVSFLH